MKGPSLMDLGHIALSLAIILALIRIGPRFLKAMARKIGILQ